jgi:hypothetical protein
MSYNANQKAVKKFFETEWITLSLNCLGAAVAKHG